MSLNPPPPIYDEQRTQLLISPSPDAVQFQKGYLGVQGERAAIEGELQIKGAEEHQWESVTITLKTLESTITESIEISSSTLILFSRGSSSSSTSPKAIPSTLAFSIPLPPDTPQCIHTPHSSLSHVLVATLHPSDAAAQALTKSIMIHTRRYTSPNHPVLINRPQTFRRDDPVTVKVEIPRTIFRIGEPIPIYITIPPPDINFIRDRSLRLRNIMAELVRVVSLGESPSVAESEVSEIAGTSAASSTRPDSSVQYHEDQKIGALSQVWNTGKVPSTSDGSHTILTRSGSSCRFHVSRPVQIRLMLHPHQTALRRSDDSTSCNNYEQIGTGSSDCNSITQSAILHTVSFHIVVDVNFMLSNSRSDSVTRIFIPVTLLPNMAPLPEVDESVFAAYRKKHDKPPARTVRHEDIDYIGNEAGPSASTPSGAPPPFEERDAPPPFFPLDPTASTSSRLPTFLESESDMGGHIPIFPIDETADGPESSGQTQFISIVGEGIEFGFTPDDQYDGISSSLDDSPSPPPSMANASMDTDVTEFANIDSQSEHALGALGQTESDMGSAQTSSHSGVLPPPPPLLDDPSDPPPSIDVEEFRRPPVPTLAREQSPPPVSLASVARPDIPVVSVPESASNANAPPPYLQPPEHSQPEESVTRPPPYVDLLPAHDISH